MYLENYFEQTKRIAKDAIENAKNDIVDLAEYVANIMLDDGVIQLYGVNHDLAFSMELGYRAGGLVQYHQMSTKDLVMRDIITAEASLAEGFLDQEGLVDKLWNMYNIQESDAFMIYVSSDVYGLTIDLAKLAKSRNHKVIVITSKNAILNSEYKENAKELLEIADKVVDLNIEYPDLLFEVNSVKVTQVANLVANLIAQTMTMEIYNYLVSHGHQADVLWSANITGADEHNRGITEAFEGRWNS